MLLHSRIITALDDLVVQVRTAYRIDLCDLPVCIRASRHTRLVNSTTTDLFVGDIHAFHALLDRNTGRSESIDFSRLELTSADLVFEQDSQFIVCSILVNVNIILEREDRLLYLGLRKTEIAPKNAEGVHAFNDKSAPSFVINLRQLTSPEQPGLTAPVPCP